MEAAMEARSAANDAVVYTPPPATPEMPQRSPAISPPNTLFTSPKPSTSRQFSSPSARSTPIQSPRTSPRRKTLSRPSSRKVIRCEEEASTSSSQSSVNSLDPSGLRRLGGVLERLITKIDVLAETVSRWGGRHEQMLVQVDEILRVNRQVAIQTQAREGEEEGPQRPVVFNRPLETEEELATLEEQLQNRRTLERTVRH